jgi:hypothetical protein
MPQPGPLKTWLWRVPADEQPKSVVYASAVLGPASRAVLVTARCLAMLVALDQIASAGMPGRCHNGGRCV